jgi:hypothetical protein
MCQKGQEEQEQASLVVFIPQREIAFERGESASARANKIYM